MSYSLIAERRRHAPRGAEGGAPGKPGRDLLDDEALPGKATGTWRPGSGSASKRPVGEDSAVPGERIGFLGLGIMGSRMAANVAAAGYPLTRVDAHPGQGRALGGRARGQCPRDAGARWRPPATSW